MSALPKLIAVVGPTASGKTALSLELAHRLGGVEIVSADARQIYRTLTIGTAKPVGTAKADEQQGITSIGALFGGTTHLDVEDVPHWGFDLLDPSEEWSAAEFQAFAFRTIDAVLGRGYLPFLVGGTGLWVRAVVEALAFVRVPPQPELRAAFAKRSASDLFHEYKQLDPEGAQVIDRQNPRRLARALEICYVTKQPASALQRPSEPHYKTLMIGLSPETDLLNDRIRLRVDQMIASGLIDEARRAYATYGVEAPGLSAIGYPELKRFFDGVCSLREAVEQIVLHTQDYAKRQRTWFRKEPVRWVSSTDEALSVIEPFLHS